jgi:transcriptional regulator with XRE-family HTH domain
MQLSTYMADNNVTDAVLAEKVGRERSTVTRWRLGKSRPDYEAMQKLEIATEGAVTFADFVREPAE